ITGVLCGGIVAYYAAEYPMAFYPITMNQVKQIYKLHSEGVGIKRIAVILGISKNTVKSYLRKTHELELTDGELMSTENPVLADQLKPVSVLEKENYHAFLQRAEYYVEELSNRKRTHVTRMILWQEDFNAGLIQLKYSRFCFHLKRYLKSKHPSMVMVHRPGEKMFVDFAGDKLHYVDRETGETIAAPSFIARYLRIVLRWRPNKSLIFEMEYPSRCIRCTS
ncbi:MAG: helix-turn-helix domain-containing protein, partial [Chryseolinea sp.]